MTRPAEAAWLLAESGLGTSQLARAAGVSVRTFQSWSEGSLVPRPNWDRLTALHELVSALPEETPEGRRRVLLSGQTGRSLFQQFLDNQPRATLIHPALTGRQQLGL